MYTMLAKFGATSVGRFWKEWLIVGLLAIVVYQNVSDTRWILWADTIPNLKSRLNVAEIELDLIEQANEQLTTAIEERNQEIDRWTNVTDELQQSTSELQDQLARISTSNRDNVRIVERQIIPQECTGAMNFLYDSVPELNYSDELELEE